MPARPIDAAEGYRLYTRHDGRIELDEINEYLRGRDLREVSPRMLTHYRRLRQHGFESYIPINRFDIAVAGEHAWSEDLRSRYGEIAQPAPGQALWDAEWHAVTIESSGSATASIVGAASPSAGGTPVAHHRYRTYRHCCAGRFSEQSLPYRLRRLLKHPCCAARFTHSGPIRPSDP